ncbi:MAG: hypothetical protein ACRDHX_13505 [Chloroflexota bacterium]
MADAAIEVTLEAQGFPPNFRYDIIRPLVEGRVQIEGVQLKASGPTEPAGLYEKPRFREGDFGLLDSNWGDLLPAIAAGWDMVLLPIFIKRKPAYNFLWVRTDRGINAPKDLEGKVFAAMGMTSAITTYTKGLLQDEHGVDLSKLHWLLNAPSPVELGALVGHIEYASGPFKSPVQRLLDGDVDASTGDISSARLWNTLESSGQVKRLFPDYQVQNQRLSKEHEIFTPVHAIAMGGKLNRQHPGLSQHLFDAFNQSMELALNDALGDGTAYSLIIHMREKLLDQMREWGDVHRHGISANRKAIDSFLRYNYEQGVTRTQLSVAQVFAGGTLGT